MIPVPPSSREVSQWSGGEQKHWQRALVIGSTELALLTRRFAMLLEAGLTVEQGLDALIEQAQGESTKRILAAVRAERGDRRRESPFQHEVTLSSGP